MTLLFYMSPWAAALLTAMAIVAEGPDPFTMLWSPATLWWFTPAGHAPLGARASTGVAYTLGLLALSGLNACLLNIANFLVTFHTSAVTLQVLGNMKNCASIGISILIFGNAIKVSQLGGIVICLTGVVIYNQFGGKLPKEASAGAKKGGEP